MAAGAASVSTGATLTWYWPSALAHKGAAGKRFPPASNTVVGARSARSKKRDRSLENAFARLDVASPSDVIECTSVFAMLQRVQITDAILVLTDTVVRDHVHTGLLTALDLEIEEQLSPFGVMLRKDEPLGRELEIFLNMLRERAQR